MIDLAKNLFFFSILFLFFLSVNLCSEQRKLINYYGSAYDLKTKELVYTDEYKEYTTKNKKLAAHVIYRNPNGEIIATKNIAYADNHSRPSFNFSNRITGVLASVTVATSNLTIKYRESFNSNLKIKSMDIQERLVVDAGFNYFIIYNWEKLIRGNVIPINYVSPSRQSIFSLQVKRMKNELWNNMQTTLFLIEVENPFMRLFVDNIILRYEMKSRRLLTYKGLSNIKLRSGVNSVYMVMKY